LNNGSAEPRVADWVTRNASDVQHGAALASPRADDATIVRVNQDGRHHILYLRGPDLERRLPDEATITPKPEALR